MKFYIAVTDKDWYSYLAPRKPDEINFWRPGHIRFQAIIPGSPFLFKLHSPDNYIVGGGFFIKYEALPLSLAWDSFGNNNGAPDIGTFHKSVLRYRGDNAYNPEIGCIILSEPFFFTRDQWIPVPSDWQSNIVSGKTYDTKTTAGASLWSQVSDLILSQNTLLGEDLLKGAAMIKDPGFESLYLVRARLGQGAFRVIVTSAYERRCAISGEKVLPVLEAAHIKPYHEDGPNHVTNGILLRSDIHKLFDCGYITVTPEMNIEVSKTIREHYHNGEHYLIYHGKKLIQIPSSRIEYPSREYLEWHNEKKFIA